ncbi:MAG TPA: 8-oxoguanine DNA glycosylase [Firmicutes bacterium]|nr:8-oxoguanine DNA glycosylase [Bacillota bacterium]
MKIRHDGNMAIITEIAPFHLERTLECGQAFRWYRTGTGYAGVVGGVALRVRQEDADSLTILDCDKDTIDLVIRYFRLREDHAGIEASLSSMDPALAEAVSFASGLRLLDQDPWECLISFIVSARNRIPLIKRAIEALSREFGRPLAGGFFAFPEAPSLASAAVESIERCGTGFRAPYIKMAAERIMGSHFDFDQLRTLPIDEARARLLEFKGVGPKVADCVLLFGCGRYEAFPVDTWIARVMSYLYFGGREVPLRRIREFASRRFGPLAGYAQEYLYYYAREHISRALRKQCG